MATSSMVKRKHRSVEERRRIVEQSLGAGVSVGDVARSHGIRPNQVFYWRKLYREGRLGNPAALLPVRVADAPVDPWGPGTTWLRLAPLILNFPMPDCV